MQFRFNVKEVEMGTRRPLIVQMVRPQLAGGGALRRLFWQGRTDS
jgi:hypothetical protein